MKDNVLIFNKLGFLSNLVIELNDQLENTNVYKQALKMHLKGAVKELEKISNHHGKAYIGKEGVKQANGEEISSDNIYNITSKAYDYLFNKQPYKIVVIAELVKKLEENNDIDWENYSVEFKPLQQ
jgi:hypothetical protein